MALNLCSQKGIFSHKKSCCYIQIILVFRIICVIKCWSTLKLHITDLSFSRTHAVRLCWRHVSIKKRAGVYIQLQLWWSVVTPCFQERASGLKTHRLPFDFQLYLEKNSNFLQHVHLFLEFHSEFYRHTDSEIEPDSNTWSTK